MSFAFAALSSFSMAALLPAEQMSSWCGCRELGHVMRLQILVYETTEAISSQRPNGRCGGRGSAACGRVLMERSVRAVGVVVLEVFLQHGREVARFGDEDVVEAFAAQGADPALGDRVRSRCSNRGADDADFGAGEHGVEGGGELGISVADQETELGGVVAEVHEQVAGLLGHRGAGGMGGDPGDADAAGAVLDHDQEVEAAEEGGVDVGAVDREDRVGLGREEVSPGRAGPRGSGSMPALFKILHRVEAATRWPSPTSSPWMRR
jgi:hypothetical protein